MAATFVLCVALIAFLQARAGAYQADFDGYPDEASHFVSGLMVYDFLTAPPAADPMGWAANYYLHYPKVALGQWPPLFHLTEALWWIPFGPSRASALVLEGALTFAAAAVFYRVAKRLHPGPVACGATLLLVAAPATVYCFSMAMADIPCLFLSVLVLDATARLLRWPSGGNLAWAGFWLTLAMLTKGSGAALAPAPALAALLAGTWRRLPLRPVFWAAGLLFALSSVWYIVQTFIFNRPLVGMGGLFRFTLPWRVDILPGMTGYGCLAAAAAGAWCALRRGRHEAVAALALAISCIGVSFVLRAMNEPRHWIIVLPAILLLAAEALDQRPKWLAAAIAAAVVATFPFDWPHFSEGGFRRFAPQVGHPARMLVSSNWIGEGAWIAEFALREPRPSSVIVRASKTLAEEGWNGDHYKLLVTSAAGVQTVLDELRVDTVVADAAPGHPVPPHQALLLAAMEDSESWRKYAVGDGGRLTAWRRVRPATIPRKPLRLDLRNRIGRVIEENP